MLLFEQAALQFRAKFSDECCGVSHMLLRQRDDTTVAQTIKRAFISPFIH